MFVRWSGDPGTFRASRAGRVRPNLPPECRVPAAAGSVSPSRIATAAASTRPDTPSLERMLPTWTPTVFWLMNRRSPISRFVRPSAISARTSRSRSRQAERVPARRRGVTDDAADDRRARVLGSGAIRRLGQPSRAPPRRPATGSASSPSGDPGPTATRAPVRARCRRDGHAVDRSRLEPIGSGRRIIARPASWLTSRRSGCAPSSRAIRAASSSGARARARAGRPSPEPRIASAWCQRAFASSYGLASAAHAPASRFQVAGSSRPSRRSRWAPAWASHASASRREPIVAPTPDRSTAFRAVRQTSRERDRIAASAARSRRVPASAAAAESTSATVEAIFAIRLQSPVPLTSSQPRAAARAGVDVVALPERERRRGAIDRDRVLGVADGVETDEDLAELTAGGLPGVRLDLDDREAVDRAGDRAAGAPLERGRADRARLGPAAEQVQRVRGVRPEEVAEDGLEALAAGHLDALVGDVDRLARRPTRSRTVVRFA